MPSSSPIDVRYISPLDLSSGVSAFSTATDTPDGMNVIFRLAGVVCAADKAAQKKRNAAATAMNRRPTFIRDPPRFLCLSVFPLVLCRTIPFMEVIATSIPPKTGPIKETIAFALPDTSCRDARSP